MLITLKLLLIRHISNGLTLFVITALCSVLNGLGAYSVASESATVFGSCNVVQQGIEGRSGATIINELDCRPPAPEESFRLRYVWLDEIATSFVVANFFEPSLRNLLGASPSIIKNDVFRQVSEIVQKFGFSINTNSYVLSGRPYFGLYPDDSKKHGQSVSMEATSAKGLPPEVMRRLKIYAGSAPIIWPDIIALRNVFHTMAWPNHYSISYTFLDGPDFKRDALNAENSIITCTLLRAAVSQEHLARYWDNVEELENAINARELRDEEVVNETFVSGYSSKGLGNYQALSGRGGLKMSTLNNQALEAMSYFGSENWPEDFLITFGNANALQCGTESFGFYAAPRKLFTLVAVIEARSRLLEIEGVTFSVDTDEKLRRLTEGQQTESAPPGVISLKRGETVMIPLRIELRYDLSSSPIRYLVDKKTPYAVRNKIMAAPMDVFRLRVEARDAAERMAAAGDTHKPLVRIMFEKLKSAFRAPEARALTESYVFGKTYGLKSITVQGRVLPVRAAPPSGLVFSSGYVTASCPFLFVSDGASEPSIIGRILVGASEAARSRGICCKFARRVRIG